MYGVQNDQMKREILEFAASHGTNGRPGMDTNPGVPVFNQCPIQSKIVAPQEQWLQNNWENTQNQRSSLEAAVFVCVFTVNCVKLPCRMTNWPKLFELVIDPVAPSEGDNKRITPKITKTSEIESAAANGMLRMEQFDQILHIIH